MRSSRSSAEGASNGALRAVESARDTTSIEPFDDVREPGVTGHTDVTPRVNGANKPIKGDTHVAEDAQRNAAHDSTHDSTRDAPHEPLSPDDPLAPLPFNPYKGNRGLTRAWHAMKNSLAGFRVAIREESAFRQELTLAAILIPCGLVVPVDPVSRVLLLGSVLLVLIVELLNSSVEAAIDRISLERHELSRRAKDLGSAAVMVALGMCLMTWGVIVGPLVVGWIRAWL
ncbi:MULTISPECIES: diacylglycerol kinase [Paraburkholderia]|uniref:Diacylglycerol kinase n=1 Tax=Paraburkholderia podalyriae TaxID=1938811 RepID=A0ABR7PNV4_9BURK|nr:diacylglycerol kinase [Paraburkholderia podalyriae]MBC8747946.1 diacylglycerol kinase [Paraburkholderia podalyriae]